MYKDNVNYPIHYTHYPMQSIDMMIAIFGKKRVQEYCIITAFKYRMRMGLKDHFSSDLEKEKWYLDKAKELEGN